MFFSGLYFGLYNQLRRTLSNLAGLLAAVFLSDTIINAISGIGSIKDIAIRVANIFFSLGEDIALKLLVGLLVFLVVKSVLFIIIGIFKKRDVKSLLKDKTALSCLLGGTLGLVNAYAVGMVLFILFSCFSNLENATIASKIFAIIPQVNELINAIRV